MTARLAIGSRDASRILRDCFEDDGEQDNAMPRTPGSTRIKGSVSQGCWTGWPRSWSAYGLGGEYSVGQGDETGVDDQNHGRVGQRGIQGIREIRPA